MTEVKKRRRRSAPAGIAPNEPERDILDQYLYEVSTYPLLKGTEEIELARKIRAGDPDALQELVKRNLRFVISVAKKYQNRGLPLIDLIGEGNRTPDLLNAIQALSQLSYAPWARWETRNERSHQEPRRIAEGISSVKKSGLAERPSAGILHAAG